jgi:DNA-binding protein H-NS
MTIYTQQINDLMETLTEADQQFVLEFIKKLDRMHQAEQALQAEQSKGIERVKKMLRNGEPINKIMDYEGISEEKVKEIEKIL